MGELFEACKRVLKRVIYPKAEEKIIIVTDKERLHIAETFKKAAENNETKILEMENVERYGEEPPKEVADEILNYDIILLTVGMSITHTKAVSRAKAYGKIILSMPGVTEETIIRCAKEDFRKTSRLSHALASLITIGKKIHISTEKGTDLEVNIEKKRGIPETGITPKSRFWGSLQNFPSGEAGLAPKNSNGTVIIDGFIGMIGLVKNEVEIIIRNNKAISIEGKEEAEKLKHVLDSADENAYNVAEVSIGLNKSAQISESILESEKAWGTCHVAFGNSAVIGGRVKSNVHIDCVIKNPNVRIDDILIVKNGEILEEKIFEVEKRLSLNLDELSEIIDLIKED